MNRVFSVLGAQELSGVFDLRPDNVIQTFHNVTVHFDQEGYVCNLLALTSQVFIFVETAPFYPGARICTDLFCQFSFLHRPKKHEALTQCSFNAGPV